MGAFGDAGMILTNNLNIARRLRLLRNQGNNKSYIHEVIGFNSRLDDLQAAILRIKLKKLDNWNKKRQMNAEYFNRSLKDLGVQLPFVPKTNTHIYHQYVLRFAPSSSRLIAHLRDKGIDCRIYYPLPLHLQKCFRYLGYKKGDFPESEKASRQLLAIPVHPDLTREEMDYIVRSIRRFCNG